MKYGLYSIGRFGEMMADHARMDAYTAALRQAVTPGCTVLDLGTGTGIFAMLACRFGAGKVYAIDPDDSINVAREAAEVNGLADRIEFMQAMSTEVVLPEQVDVIISDLRGVLPLFHHHIPSIVDARERLLRPGGTMIPMADTLRMAVVSDPREYDRYVGPWEHDGYGFDLKAARSLVTNTWNISRVGKDALITEPTTIAVLDYATITDPNLRADLTLPIPADSTAHGLTIWFDAAIGEDLGFTNAPGEPELIYGRAFLPLTEPVEMLAGDTITVSLRADLVGDDYLWRWSTRVEGRAGTCKAQFNQSELHGLPLDMAALVRSTPDHAPELAMQGEIDRTALSLMDGQTTLAENARQLTEAFPQRFGSIDAALAHVLELSRRYAK